MEHYFSKLPTSKKSIKEITAIINGTNYKFFTSSGVFSKDEVDKGTLLLIESVDVNKDDSILDLGCGYGVIGIAFANYAKNVLMTDINERAIELAKMNVKVNKLNNVNVIFGDLYNGLENMKFDKIICNPPIRAGKSVVNDVIVKSIEHLGHGGSLYLVARTKQGAKSIAKKMKEVFGNQIYIQKSGGYRVMLSTKE